LTGAIRANYRKHRLPNYEVFDEERYFRAGQSSPAWRRSLACAADWPSAPTSGSTGRRGGGDGRRGTDPDAQRLALPHEQAGPALRGLRDRIAATGKPVVYANLVGGQDELVFDGASFALDGQGRLTHQFPPFVEHLACIDYADGHLLPGAIAEPAEREAEVYAALKLGVADYLGKNGFPGAILGLSGGIDSALTLAIAVDALGADKVRCVMMPSPWTAQMSLDDSREMVRRLGVQYDEIPIAAAMEQFAVSLAPTFASLGPKPSGTPPMRTCRRASAACC
jgi:hypothetical protein